MPRYFIDVAYRGTAYSGFQVQENAPTVQSKIEHALVTLLPHLRQHQGDSSSVQHEAGLHLLTGSSRTDAGVHALQNYFHFDSGAELPGSLVYQLNSILPADIAVRRIIQVRPDAHCRFDASSRRYTYRLHKVKNPFLNGLSLYYPFQLNIDLLHQAADLVRVQTNFFAFSKTNSQVKNFNCKVLYSNWNIAGDQFIYTIEGNRFLRGMVRLLTGTILKVAREKLSFSEMELMFSEQKRHGHSVPAHGLFLESVNYPADYFNEYRAI